MDLKESKLIMRAIQGNLDAFNQLVVIYQTAVYNTALRIMNDSEAADDITQTAFISAWQHMESFKGDSFKPWILRITINACYDEIRRLRRHPSTPLEPVTEENEENEDAVWLIDPNLQPDEVSLQKDTMAAVAECMGSLPEEYRTVLMLIDVHEFNYQDAADMISKPLGTIKSRLLRARLRMRTCLESKGELYRSQNSTDNKDLS